MPGDADQRRLRVPVGRKPPGPLCTHPAVAASLDSPRKQVRLYEHALTTDKVLFRHTGAYIAWQTCYVLGCRGARIINLSSEAHRFGQINFKDLQSKQRYSPWAAYGASKLANVLFTYELARRLPASAKVTVNAVHPGVVSTELWRCSAFFQSAAVVYSRTASLRVGADRYFAGNSFLAGPLGLAAKLFLKTPQQGAETSVHLASSPAMEGVSGKYWVDCAPKTSSPASYNADTACRYCTLWCIWPGHQSLASTAAPVWL